jgi:hypothetical protein
LCDPFTRFDIIHLSIMLSFGLIQIPLGHMSAGLVLYKDKVRMERANSHALERENEAYSDSYLFLLVK